MILAGWVLGVLQIPFQDVFALKIGYVRILIPSCSPTSQIWFEVVRAESWAHACHTPTLPCSWELPSGCCLMPANPRLGTSDRSDPREGIFPNFSYFSVNCCCLFTLFYFILSFLLFKATIYFLKRLKADLPTPPPTYVHTYTHTCIHVTKGSRAVLLSQFGMLLWTSTPSVKWNQAMHGLQG